MPKVSVIREQEDTSFDPDHLPQLIQRFEADPAAFEQAAEEDPSSDEAKFLQVFHSEASTKIAPEMEALNKKLEVGLKRFFEQLGLPAEEGVRLATDDHDNRHREKLKTFLSRSQDPQAELFLKLARWINQPGAEGLKYIFRTFGVDSEGQLASRYTGEASPLLRKLAGLAVRLAGHPDWVGRVGFVRGATLRLDPMRPEEPLNPRHKFKLDAIRNAYARMQQPRSGERQRSTLFRGEDPENLFWQSFIDTLQEWTDSIQLALQGASWSLRRHYSKQFVQWEARYLRSAEDLIHEAMTEDGYSAMDLIDQVFTLGNPLGQYVVPGAEKLPPSLTGNQRDYATVLDAIEDLSPPERSQLRVWFYRRVYHHLKQNYPEDLERAMTWLSALMVETEFHRSNGSDLSPEFTRIWRGFQSVKSLMEETWESVSRYVSILKRQLKNPMIRAFLKDRDLERINSGLPPALSNQAHRDLVHTLLNTSLDAEDRRFLQQFKEHPWVMSNVYLYTEEGIASPKLLIYFLSTNYRKLGSQRSWFATVKTLQQVVKDLTRDTGLY